MKNHSCLPGCTNGLRGICGTSIDIEALDFAQSRNHLLYVDKVYSKGQGIACPLVFNLATSPSTFQTQLLLSPLSTHETDHLCEEILGSDCHHHHHDHSCGHSQNGIANSGFNCCNCNCNCNVLGAATCQLDENAVFTVLKSYVKVTNFGLANPTGLSPTQVTIDGSPVDNLFNTGGSYEAILSSSLPDIIKSPCAENGLPTKAFFLISCVGPWVYQAEFVIEGTVNTGGRICCFKATFTTISTSPVSSNIPISNIAVPKISIPCVTDGMAPRIFFTFGGNMNLLNPVIKVVPDSENDNLRLVLCTSVAVEPTVDIQVLKQTLVCINGCEALFPCEGTESAVESAEEEEGPLDPECPCSPRRNPANVQGIMDNSNCGNTIAFGANSSYSNCCRGF